MGVKKDRAGIEGIQQYVFYVIWQDTHGISRQIYRTYVRPVMTYGSKTWVIR